MSRGRGARAPRRARFVWRSDEGSAIVEFLGLGVLLALPMTYLVLGLSNLQAATLASVTISDQSARTYAGAPDAATGRARAQTAVEEMARGHGVDPSSVSWTVHCQGPCPGPGSHVTSDVTIQVRLPLLPGGSRFGTVKTSSTVYVPTYG